MQIDDSIDFSKSRVLLSLITLFPAEKTNSDATVEAGIVSISLAILETTGNLPEFSFHHLRIFKSNLSSSVNGKDDSKYVSNSLVTPYFVYMLDNLLIELHIPILPNTLDLEEEDDP